MESWLHTASALLVAVAFGSMVFFASVVAPLAFTRLPAEVAATFVRQLFPAYYASLGAVTAAAALLALPSARVQAAILLVIALAFAYARQVLMPRINALRDRELAGDASAAPGFRALHRRSVLLNLTQMLLLLLLLVLELQ